MYDMEYKNIITEEIALDVKSFSEYPDTSEDMMLYKEYLKEQLSQTKANIVSKSFQFGLSSIISLSSIALLYVGINDNVVKEIVGGGMACFMSLMLIALAIKEIPVYKEYLRLYSEQKKEMEEFENYSKTRL